jgi:PadR family transcriptional regulator AphA
MSLRFAVLGLLNYSAMNGYDLNKMFEDSIDHFWHASMSQIYRELNALEAGGFLTSEVVYQQEKPNKRIYQITPEGKAAFERWLKDIPESPVKNTRDEFSLRLFFGGSMERRDLIREFERFRAQKKHNLEEVGALLRLSGEYARKLALFGNEEVYWTFILRRARLNLEAAISWADECIAELERLEEK